MKSISSVRIRRFAAAAVAAAAGASALAIAPAGASADVRVSPNFPMLPDRNPIYGRDGIGLAVNPKNNKHLVAVYADWHNLYCEVAMSRNGGATWRRTRLRAPEGFVSPPCTVGGHLSQLVDQSIAFGRGNNVYTTFASASAKEEDPEGQSALVARSTNGGRTFATSTVALKGGERGSVGPDYSLPEVAVVPARSRSGSDRVYVSAGASQTEQDNTSPDRVVFAVSNDGARSWSAPQRISAPNENSIEPSGPVIGKGGDLYVAWRTQDPDPNQAGRYRPEGTLVVARSTDDGRTWSRTRVARVRGFVRQGLAEAPFPANAFFTASSFARLAADRRSGNVYITYGNGDRPTRPDSAAAADHFIHPDMDVYFQRSTDRGSSWSEPSRLNGQPPVYNEPVTQTRHPYVSVAKNGRVDVVWNDRRHWYRACTHTHVACEEARLQDTYYRYSTNRGLSFQRERRITDRHFNGDVGFDYRFGSYWDYGPVSVPIGGNRLMVAWMDSREGNVETDSMGIWLARVNHQPGKRVPVQRIGARNATDLSATLSRLAYPGGAEAVLAGTFATRPWSRAVIVHPNDIPGMLAGNVLARAHIGPVLLTNRRGGLSSRVRQELERFAPIGAFIVGGGAIPASTEAELASTGIPADQITRITRPGDQAGTIADVATAMDRRKPADKSAGKRAFDAAMLVNPASRDSVAAAALATNRRLPILLTGRDSVPAATTQALSQLNIDKVLVVGGTRAISNAVAQQMPGAQRLNGNNPAGTSRSVALASRDRGLPDNITYAVSANKPQYAALVGGAAGRLGGLLLLTEPGRGARATLKAMGLQRTTDRIVNVGRGRGR